MVYFKYIDNGQGPTKVFIGGVHGNEGKTSATFLKSFKKEDFAPGQIYLYNFDKSKYISTLKTEYFQSKMGLKILELIEELKPDFYTELHCYDLAHFERLTSMERFKTQGVPPLIDLGNHVLIGSVSPLIRLDYFQKGAVCQTLEFPCISKLNDEIMKKYDFNLDMARKNYKNYLDLIAKSNTRKQYEEVVFKQYPEQAKLAGDFARKVFGKFFPPY